MDAAHRFLLVSAILSLFLAGCNQAPKVKAANANCSNSVVPHSYLVRWNGKVPAEYEKYKLNSNSLVTRFTGTDSDTIEREVLSRHPSEYIVAENDFQIKNIKEEQTITPSSNAPTWGPQDIQTSDAWSFMGKKGDGVIVAVVDSGADVNHPLLKSQILGGYNFTSSIKTDVSDGADHGTHVAGVIAGQPDGSGFTGIAPNAKILPVKFIDSNGGGTVGDAISATVYAVSKGAKVINASWGGSQCSSSLQQEINDLSQSGTVFVNASGNDGLDISIFPDYPAVYQAPGKITVGAYSITETLSAFSNYGSLVDVAAPGESILSTVPPTSGQSEGQMGVKSGTSMATPFVSGVAALLLSAKPTATSAEIVSAINAGVVPGHFGVRTGGHVNALLAAQYLMSH